MDAYFDNVGGDMLDTLLLHMAPFGRILIWGAMFSGYSDVRLQGPTNYMRICTHMLTRTQLACHATQAAPQPHDRGELRVRGHADDHRIQAVPAPPVSGG